MSSSRRSSTRRSTSLYSRSIQEPPKVYDQTSDDLDSDASEPFEEDDEETLKLEDAAYHSEEEEMDEEQEDMMEEEDEEEEEEEEMEGDDEEMEGDDEEEMEGDDEEEMEEEPDEEEPEEDIEEQLEEDIDVEVEELEDADATPVDDEEDEFAVEDSDEDEEEEEDEDDEQSDYEEEMSSRRTRGGTIHRSQSQSSMKPEEPSISRKRGSITETSSSSHGNRILTKRQRAKLNENYQQDLLQLPMEPMKKKHMTEEEIALKKSEIARRRKHQSIQRAEQDKMETINRLLKKQSTKKRMRDQDETDSVQNESNNNNSLPPSSFHYVNNVEGSTFSIPIGVDMLTQFEKGPKYPPPVPNCAFPGCNVPKKYCSVKTLKYACSMDHLHKLESKG